MANHSKPSPSHRFVGVGVAVVALVVSGCASAPAYRPVGPPMGTAGFEAGAGVHGVVGQDRAGVGSGVWVTGQVAQDILLVARAHGTELFPYEGGEGGLLSDVQYGGSAGFRGVFNLHKDLILGGEVTIDYLELRDSRNKLTQQFVSGVVSFPVAEEAFPGFWVYVQPTLGAGPRFGDVNEPFSGFTEVPIGVAWQAADWAVIVAEGGFAIPFAGGYFGVAGAFRF